MKKTTVFQFIYGLDDGGAETLVKDYASLIDKNKFEIKIVVIRIKGLTANLKRVKDANVTVIPIYRKWNFFSKAWHKIAGKYYVPHAFIRIVKKYRPNVIHVHFGLLKTVYKVSKKLNGISMFYTCHNIPSLYFGQGKEEEKKAAQQLIKVRNLRLIALHNDMASELNDLFNVDNTIMIRNGIDMNKFLLPGITKIEKRKELGIPEDAFVLGHVGRFMEQKNHKFLVEVFNEVAKINSKAYLLMVGAGETEDVVNKLTEYGLEKRYIILPNRTDVNEIMKAMDVFVFPSLFEGLGIVMIEAQASGLKCVASDQVPEEAFKTEKAIALPLGDAKRWAEVILDENAKGNIIGNLDDYDMNKEIRRLEKLYLGDLDV